jgi:4-hydroxybenzoate polyprenyltransferase
MKLATALRLGRVSNLPTTWTNVAAGLALSGGHATPQLGVVLCVAISSMYVGGMYLNDAFDREYDARERPERPIPSGAVKASTVFALGFAMLAFGVAIVAGLAFTRPFGMGMPPLLAALALAGVIVFYDAFHKQNRFSPVVMACNRVLVYVTAALSVRAVLTPALWIGCALSFCYLVGLTYAAKQENLREPRGMWPLALIELPFLLYVFAAPSPLRIGAYVLLASWVAYSLLFLIDPRRRNIKRAVGYLIAGISLLDALLIAGSGSVLGAALCVVGFGLTLSFQRFIPGT